MPSTHRYDSLRAAPLTAFGYILGLMACFAGQCLAQTPGHNDWYWESRVNLHIDNHSSPVGKGYTVAQLTEMMRDIPVSMIQVSALGNGGALTTYPSQVLPSSGGNWDTPGAWKQVAANLDWKFCIYMNSLGLDQWERHPEWMRRRADGSGYPQRGGYRMCVKPTPGKDGWLETTLLPVVEEVVTKYKPDGIWMDGDWNINNDVCWCDNCKKDWQLKTGKSTVPTGRDDPDWPTWLRLHYDRVFEYRRIVADAIHEIHPACMYTSNGAWRSQPVRAVPNPYGAWDDPRSAPEYVGTLSHDYSARDALKRTRLAAMALSAEEDTPHDIMHLVANPRISIPRLQQWASLTMTGGSAWFMWTGGGIIESQDREKACARFVLDRGDILGRGHSQNPVAVLTSETSWERHRMDGKDDYWTPATLENAAMALQDARFGVDIINEHILNSRVCNYRILVISDNQREVLPQTVESLKAFVKEGGMLLVMGSGLLDCPGKDGDIESLLGLKRTGTAEASNSVNMGEKTTSFSSVWDIETSGAEVLAAYDNGKTFLTRNKVGKGAVAYVSAAGPIPYPDNDGVFSRIMDKLSVKPWVQIQSGDQGKHLVYSFRSEPGRLYLHVVNLTSHVNGQRIEPNSSDAIDPVVVIPRLELSLELPAQPREVTVVPAASGVKHTWNNGRLTLEITNVDYHAAVEIGLDGQFKVQNSEDKK